MAVSQGCVLMAPPSSNEEAKTTLAGLLSAIKPKTKVCSSMESGILLNGVLVIPEEKALCCGSLFGCSYQ